MRLPLDITDKFPLCGLSQFHFLDLPSHEVSLQFESYIGLEGSTVYRNLAVEIASVICKHFTVAVIRSQSSNSLRSRGDEDFSNYLTADCT